jgi:hypothetical protein
VGYEQKITMKSLHRPDLYSWSYFNPARNIDFNGLGSKTPSELALLLEETTLITGDLVRSPVAGSLTILPGEKLLDRENAIASVHPLVDLEKVEAVLVGDGWSIFRDGRERLQELMGSLG